MCRWSSTSEESYATIALLAFGPVGRFVAGSFGLVRRASFAEPSSEDFPSQGLAVAVVVRSTRWRRAGVDGGL